MIDRYYIEDVGGQGDIWMSYMKNAAADVVITSNDIICKNLPQHMARVR